MEARTNSQKMAQAAYRGVTDRLNTLATDNRDKYKSFARSFPSLVHACGLAQAVAFGAKDHEPYLQDLAAVLQAAGHSEATSANSLEHATREQTIAAYVRLSRNALQAAGWLKRYVEAVEQK